MQETAVGEITQYLTFTLEDELFAIDIGKVREVLDYTAITRVPHTPEFMRGVINLRGSVVPVVDMKVKFGMTATDVKSSTCIIIVEVVIDGETTVLGALADSVQEVLDLGSNQVEPAPRIGTRLNIEFIRGMGKHENQFLIILDVDKVFSCDELLMVRDAGQPTEGVVDL